MKQIKVKSNIDPIHPRQPQQFPYNQSINQADKYLMHSNDIFKILANLSFYRETSVAIVIHVNTF